MSRKEIIKRYVYSYRVSLICMEDAIKKNDIEKFECFQSMSFGVLDFLHEINLISLEWFFVLVEYKSKVEAEIKRKYVV